MTELLYYNNPGMLEFTARLLSVETEKKQTALVLDRTAFYPEGGGQPADRGTIAGLEIADVRKKDGLVLHYIKAGQSGSLPETGTEVDCAIDYEHRFDYMQQHSGQHLISAALMKTAGIGTVSVHQGEDYTAIETDAEEISAGLIQQIEDEANRSIRTSVNIEAFMTDSEGIEKWNLRRPTKHKTDIRLINIPGIDCVACGGIHLRNTVEAGLIKFTHREKIRGHIRTFWKIGKRAYRDYAEKTLIINSLNELYSSRQFEIVEKSQAASEGLNDLKYQYAKLEEDYASLFASILISEAEKHLSREGRPVVIKVFDDRSKGFINSLLKTLAGSRTNPGPAFIFNRSSGVLTWAVAASDGADFNFNEFRNDYLPLIDGKGGGRAPLWQGAAKNPDGLGQLIDRLNEYGA